MIIVVTTFGFGNVIDTLVELGLAAIPSWFAVGMLYFLPLALILAEFASDNTESPRRHLQLHGTGAEPDLGLCRNLVVLRG